MNKDNDHIILIVDCTQTPVPKMVGVPKMQQINGLLLDDQSVKLPTGTKQWEAACETVGFLMDMEDPKFEVFRDQLKLWKDKESRMSSWELSFSSQMGSLAKCAFLTSKTFSAVLGPYQEDTDQIKALIKTATECALWRHDFQMHTTREQSASARNLPHAYEVYARWEAGLIQAVLPKKEKTAFTKSLKPTPRV